MVQFSADLYWEHLGEEAVLKATQRLMDEIYTERFNQLKNLDHPGLVEPLCACIGPTTASSR